MSEKILLLHIKKKWFDMIASGEKKEEYRKIKPYWVARLCDKKTLAFKSFDIVAFKNGYGKNSPSIKIECLGIYLGEGNKDWGFEKRCFVISLGEIINQLNG